MDKGLLIVGVDPGTTLGYALLDIDGNILKLKSSKLLDLNSLISEVIKEGYPVIVGTDRKDLPDFVSKFRTKIGARLVMPEEDMPVGYKKNLTKEYSREVGDEHQRDALASAIFAFKKFRPLITKIDNFIEKNKKENLRQDLIALVVKNDISLNYAMEILEQPETEENKIIKKVIEENKFDKDFLKLYDKLKRLQRENSLIKQQNEKIKGHIRELERLNDYIKRKIKQLNPDRKAQEQLSFKEERIAFMNKELQTKDEKISSLQEEVDKLYNLMAGLSDNILIKKIKNLGWNEIENKNKILKINKGDVLLVEDPTIYSEKSLQFLKNKIDVVIYKNKVSTKIKNEFVFINFNRLNIKEDRYFAIVERKELEKLRKEENVIDQIVTSYRKARL